MKIKTLNEFDEVRFKNLAESYMDDGYVIQSTSCSPNADGETVWCAILLLKDSPNDR